MTTEELLDDILRREGGYVDHPSDRGGPTKYGITVTTLGGWRRLGRQATRAEVQHLGIVEAKEIYRRRYLQPFESVPFDELRAQLVDYGVHAGPATAIRALQEVLGVTVDGILGDRTQAALVTLPWKCTNNSLLARRVKHYADVVRRDPAQAFFLKGWLFRACDFWVS